MAFGSLTKQIKEVLFFHGAKAEFFKFKWHFIILAKQHDLFRVLTDEVCRKYSFTVFQVKCSVYKYGR